MNIEIKRTVKAWCDETEITTKGFEVTEMKNGRITIKKEEKDLGITVDNRILTLEEFEKMLQKLEEHEDFDVKSMMEKEKIMENTRIVAKVDLSKYEGSAEPEVINQIGETKFLLQYDVSKWFPEDEGKCSIILTKPMLKELEIDKEKLLKKAREKTMEDIEIKTMAETLVEIMGLEPDEIPEEMLQENNMYVVSNHEKCNGSGILENPHALYKVLNYIRMKESTRGNRINLEDMAILPSSIHEMLVVVDKNLDMRTLATMVAEVNATQVEPRERMEDKAYKIRFEGVTSCFIEEYDTEGETQIYHTEVA